MLDAWRSLLNRSSHVSWTTLPFMGVEMKSVIIFSSRLFSQIDATHPAGWVVYGVFVLGTFLTLKIINMRLHKSLGEDPIPEEEPSQQEEGEGEEEADEGEADKEKSDKDKECELEQCVSILCIRLVHVNLCVCVCVLAHVCIRCVCMFM